MKTIIINENDCGQRLDRFLTKSFKNLPKDLMYKHIRKKNIKIDGKKCMPSTKLLFGQELKVYIKDDLLADCNKKFNFLKASDELNIVYEDQNLILINKESGVLCQSDRGNPFDSLVDRIKRYLYTEKKYFPDKERSFSPALVNRIDRNTSGLVIAAKNARALRIACEKIRNREIKKFYICVVEGCFEEEEGEISGFIKKNEDLNKVEVLNEEVKNSKYAVTKYQVLFKKGDKSLVEAEILTGRSHQIRAQFAHIGHPILSDRKYGRRTRSFHQALCSYKLKFCFNGNNDALDYINGKQFKVNIDWFLKKFF
ncbi:MAG: RluA family pseudouridine synthase [Oscillospiraceae bacterium]|nr:RluA family pseudouridine synthase [Oscillospiraceae bacterium]